MYYHNSPTTTNIKKLKAARAEAMKIHLRAMKQITKDFEPLLKELEQLRIAEIEIAAALRFERLDQEQAAIINKKIANRQAHLDRKVDSFLSVE